MVVCNYISNAFTASPFNSIPSIWNPLKGYIHDVHVYDPEVKLPGEYNSIMSS